MPIPKTDGRVLETRQTNTTREKRARIPYFRRWHLPLSVFACLKLSASLYRSLDTRRTITKTRFFQRPFTRLFYGSHRDQRKKITRDKMKNFSV